MSWRHDGTCPALECNRCTIYAQRPTTCRDYDCRVFVPAGLDAGDERKAVINERIRAWRFRIESADERDAFDAIRRHATFIRDRRECFPNEGRGVPSAPTGIAVLAMKSFGVFLREDIEALADPVIAAAIVDASRRFDESAVSWTQCRRSFESPARSAISSDRRGCIGPASACWRCSRLADHDGFDGVMLAFPTADYHFEFTICHGHAVRPSPTAEDLVVLYVPDEAGAERAAAPHRGFARCRRSPAPGQRGDVRGPTAIEPCSSAPSGRGRARHDVGVVAAGDLRVDERRTAPRIAGRRDGALRHRARSGGHALHGLGDAEDARRHARAPGRRERALERGHRVPVDHRGTRDATMRRHDLVPPERAGRGLPAYFLSRDHWGKGYAFEAATALLGLVRRATGDPRILATVDVENLRSRRLLERLGLRLDRVETRATLRPNVGGPPRDTAVYARSIGIAGRPEHAALCRPAPRRESAQRQDGGAQALLRSRRIHQRENTARQRQRDRRFDGPIGVRGGATGREGDAAITRSGFLSDRAIHEGVCRR